MQANKKILNFGGPIAVLVIGFFLSKSFFLLSLGFFAGQNFLFLKNKFLKNKKLEQVNLEIPKENESKIKYDSKIYDKYNELKKVFNSQCYINVFKETSQTSLIQLERASEKFDRFIEILNNKFNSGEITYSKFFLTVEKVYLVILENLDLVKNKYIGIGGKDYDYLIERLVNLEKMEKLNKAQLDEMSAIRLKKGIVKKELKEIENLLSQTEHIISNLDKILIEVSSLKTTNNFDVDSSYSVAELERLIREAKQYSIN